VGEGVALGSVTPTFTGGNLEGTGVPTDAAITGNGLFVTEQNGVMQYTGGNFTVDSQGQLTTQNGQLVRISSSKWRYQPVTDLGTARNRSGPTHPGNRPQRSRPRPSRRKLGCGHEFFYTHYCVRFAGTSHVLTYQFTKTASNAWSYKHHLTCRRYRGHGRTHGD